MGTAVPKIHHTLSGMISNGQFKRESYSLVQVLQLAKDIASGMRYLHHEFMPGFPIIHAELTPDSIGMDIDGKLRITSLGHCHYMSPNQEDFNLNNHTNHSWYSAPEILAGNPITEKVDVYSFSLILWAMASNEVPFRNDLKESQRKLVLIYNERPPLGKDWPEEFCGLLQSCWQQDTNVRPSFDTVCVKLTNMIDQGLQYKMKTTSNMIMPSPLLKANKLQRIDSFRSLCSITRLDAASPSYCGTADLTSSTGNTPRSNSSPAASWVEFDRSPCYK